MQSRSPHHEAALRLGDAQPNLEVGVVNACADGSFELTAMARITGRPTVADRFIRVPLQTGGRFYYRDFASSLGLVPDEFGTWSYRFCVRLSALPRVLGCSPQEAREKMSTVHAFSVRNS